MKFEEILLGEEEMIELERRLVEDLLRDLGQAKPVFFVGCSGGKSLCNPGGEEQLQQIKKQLILLGVPFSGTLLVDALCNKGLDELTLLRQFRQVDQSEALLVMSCAVGVQALQATSGKKVVPALRTLSATGFEGVLGEKGLCRLCGDCYLDLSGGLCPIYFCPKGLLNGPCQGASHGRCEVDTERACGWELIYERLKKQGRLEALKRLAQPKDHTGILPLIRLRSTVAAGMGKD